MTAVRTFVGIPLAVDLADKVADACVTIRELDPRWREEKWVPRENLHITLKFIGNVPQEDLPSLADAIGAAAGEGPAAFALPFGALKAVPSRGHVRMIWATFTDPDGACSALAAAVERTVLAFGAQPDERAFTPHATLVRSRKPHALSETALAAARDVASRPPGAMSVVSATLYSSTLTPTGPVYTELRSYPLRVD